MRAIYSVPNLAWIVLWNGNLQDIRGRRFWEAKDDLIHDLTQCGLKIVAGNKIVASED